MKPNNIILYIIVLACIYFGFDAEWGYTAETAWWTHLSFHFAHGNVFHAAANLFVLFLLLMERNDKWWWWIVSFAVATACSFIVVADKPTVGLSGVLFVACGVVTTKDGVRWKPLLQMLLFMAVTLFVSSVAVYLHFICLFAGVLIGCACAVTDEIKRKERMYGN